MEIDLSKYKITLCDLDGRHIHLTVLDKESKVYVVSQLEKSKEVLLSEHIELSIKQLEKVRNENRSN